MSVGLGGLLGCAFDIFILSLHPRQFNGTSDFFAYGPPRWPERYDLPMSILLVLAFALSLGYLIVGCIGIYPREYLGRDSDFPVRR